MQAIIDFFVGLFDIVVALVEFVISFIEDIIYVIQLTALFLKEIPNYFAWLPTAFTSMLVLIFGIVVIYKVLGREG